MEIKKYPTLCLLLVACLSYKAASSQSQSHLSPAKTLKEYSSKAVANSIEFIQNKGQVADVNGSLRPDVTYVGDGGGARIYLRKTGLSYVYTIPKPLYETMEHTESENVAEMQRE